MSEHTGQAAPHATAVHVAAHGGNLDGGADTLLEALLGQGHEGLLDSLVGQRLLVVHVADVSGDLGESRVLGVGKVVKVEQTSVGLGDLLAIRGVEGHVVEAVERSLGRKTLSSTVPVGVAIGTALQQLLTLAVCPIGGIEGLGVAAVGVVAVNDGVFGGQIRLIEVIGVLHVGATQTGLNDDGGVRADQHSDGTGTTSGARIALGIQGNISSDDKAVPSVPARGLDPIDSVEDGIGTTIAGIDSVDTLDVGVVAEQLHDHRLDGLGLVQKGLGTDLETANGVGVDLVLLEQVGSDGEGEGVDVYRARAQQLA